jgi:hypothetical protein
MSTAAATTAPRAREILRAPGIGRTYGTSLIARLPMGAHGLVLLLFVSQLTGSYALGGAASGAFALSLALSSPPLGRLIDRHGQTRVLVPLALAQAAVHFMRARQRDAARTARRRRRHAPARGALDRRAGRPRRVSPG